MFVPGLPLLIVAACVVLAYRYAEMEGLSGIFWGAMSLLLWIVPGLLLPVGFLTTLFLQFVLLVLIRVLAIRRHGY